ncbi:hypothetical protein [Streptomyces sp. SBT349]|uniref:hypothetical protein n=1 Tax=Streptomyces sp. SBT349 TaxID=1580539 RepID=UPI00131C551A|nr:hypothetical protein [Streptomyces sp. SBT349]
MNFSYHLGAWNQQPGQRGMDIRLAREISESECDNLIDAINAYESLTERGAFNLVIRGYSNIKMMLHAFSNAEQFGGNFRRLNRDILKESLISELTNWLAARRLYLENERNLILSQYSDASGEMDEFRQATSAAFDSREGYRFLYNLRDYVQHCGLPPGSLHVSGSTEKRRVVLTLDKSRLLTARFNWSKHAKTLLLSWPAAIPLLPLMDEAMDGYARIEERMLRINLRRCIQLAPLLLQSLRSFDHSGGAPALFKFSSTPLGADSVNIATRGIPAISELGKVISAASTEDAFESLRVTEVEPPPKMPSDGGRSSAVLTALFGANDPSRATEAINVILQRDGKVDFLISDLVNTSALLTHMLSQILGASSYSLLGKIGPDSNNQ